MYKLSHSTLFLASSLLAFACQGDLRTADPDLAPRNDIVCEARVPISGTFAPDGSTPPEELLEGCWPYGTWSIALGDEPPDELDSDCADLPLGASYEYQVEHDDELVQKVTFAQASGVEPLLRIKQAGDECQGTFEHFSDDRRAVLRIKAFVTDPGEIRGTADFEVFSRDQI